MSFMTACVAQTATFDETNAVYPLQYFAGHAHTKLSSSSHLGGFSSSVAWRPAPHLEEIYFQ